MVAFAHHNRRTMLALLGAAAVAPVSAGIAAGEAVITVHKDPSCGCCSGWAQHLQKAGFATKVMETRDLDAVKARLGVPGELAACHTAEIGGCVREVHVPAAT